jgi:hypothetical protein
MPLRPVSDAIFSIAHQDSKIKKRPPFHTGGGNPCERSSPLLPKEGLVESTVVFSEKLLDCFEHQRT